MSGRAVALTFVACLAAAIGAWLLRAHGEEAELAAAGVALVCIAAAAATLLRRRLVAGLAVLTAGAGLWAATGGLDRWMDRRAVLFVGGALMLALLGLVLGGTEPTPRA